MNLAYQLLVRLGAGLGLLVIHEAKNFIQAHAHEAGTRLTRTARASGSLRRSSKRWRHRRRC